MGIKKASDAKSILKVSTISSHPVIGRGGMVFMRKKRRKRAIDYYQQKAGQ